MNGVIDDNKKREKLVKYYRAVLAKHPNCEWAKNELRFMDVQFLPPPLKDEGLSEDIRYHGGPVQ